MNHKKEVEERNVKKVEKKKENAEEKQHKPPKNIDEDKLAQTITQNYLLYDKVGSNKLFYDLIYNPSRTKFLLKKANFIIFNNF